MASARAPVSVVVGLELGGVGLASGPLLDARRLAREVAQVVEARPADRAAADHLDAVDPRRVHGEDALDAHPVADLAHGERGAGGGVVPLDHHALEGLGPLLVALLDEDPYADGVAYPELRQ